MIMQRLRLLFGVVREADREDRIDNYRRTAEEYEAKALAARAEIPKIMSEPIVEKMREAGL